MWKCRQSKGHWELVLDGCCPDTALCPSTHCGVLGPLESHFTGEAQRGQDIWERSHSKPIAGQGYKSRPALVNPNPSTQPCVVFFFLIEFYRFRLFLWKNIPNMKFAILLYNWVALSTFTKCCATITIFYFQNFSSPKIESQCQLSNNSHLPLP